MAKVLLIDTSFSSSPIRQALRQAGFNITLVGGKTEDFMARSDPHYLQVDYSDPLALQQALDLHQPDFLVPGCNDVSWLACANVQNRMNQPGLDSLQNALSINNKNRFRQHCQQLDLPCPQVFEHSATPNASLFNQPVLVKPVDSYSGRGITHLEKPTPYTLQNAIETAQSHSNQRQAIVEQYITGQLYSHSAFLQNQTILQDFWVEEHGTANPFSVDTSWVVPDFPEPHRQTVRHCIEKLARALHLQDGLIHTQFILDDQQPWLIEMTRRCPGDLYSQLIELTTGYPYAANYMRAFVGLPFLQPSVNPNDWKPVMRHTLTVKHPVALDTVKFNRPLHFIKWVPLTTTGSPLASAPQSRIGIAFVQEKNQQTLKELLTCTLRRELYEVTSGC